MRTRAIALRITRQFLHDRRTMALMFAAPLIVLSLMSLVFNGKTYEPAVGLTGRAAVLAPILEGHGAAVNQYRGPAQGEDALRAGDIDALISPEDKGVRVLLEGSDPSVNRAVQLLLEQSRQEMARLMTSADAESVAEGNMVPPGSGRPASTDVLSQPAVASAAAGPALAIDYLYGSADMKTLDRFGPVMIGVFVFFFVFLISGVSFLRERTTGTLERLLATPLRRWEIVIGYVGGFGLFTLVQAVLITWFSIDVLGIQMAGSFVYVLLVTLLLSMTALTLGTLLSAFAANELQMIQFIPLIIVPQIFLSGLFPLDTLPLWVQRIGWATPLYYGADALTNVMIRGKGWGGIALSVWVLAGFSLVFIALNVLALRKHRKL